MKRILLTPLLALLFAGCGSLAVESDDESSSLKQDSGSAAIPNDKSYRLYDYLRPSLNLTVKSYKYTNRVFQSDELLEYINDADLTIERSFENRDGKVEYQSMGDTIHVALYSGTKVESFSMKNFLNVGDVVTLKESECKVSQHFDKLIYIGNEFSDVLKISCPQSIGYYEKDRGLVVENIIDNSLQESAFIDEPTIPKREIGRVDAYIPGKLSTYNLDSAIEAQVDKLWASPYHLTGTGMKIGLVDGGAVRETHVEFDTRVTNLNNQNGDNHATHVAGTLVSAGRQNSDSRGFANSAQLYALAYAEIYFADSIKKLAVDYGILISNHSYGYSDAIGFGEYDGNSKNLDIAIRENPYMLTMIAAGNDGDSDFGSWGLIKGGSNAKNVITVGALEDDSNHIASFSSTGPIEGGRLKPDIVMDGYNVLSTVYGNDNDSYKRDYGTSMATPAATGTITLLAQRYKEVNQDNDVRLDTMKAILFNTAKDVENKGPDYKSGFGRIDALAAVRVIDSMQLSNETLVRLDKIYQNDTQRYFINSKRYQDFKVTVAWVDDTYQNCNGCANDMLINDIDMVLIDMRTGEKIYPYTLSESSPYRDAVQTKENHIDPQEQISFPLGVGNYTLEIRGHKISPSGQDFTLVSSLAIDAVQKDIASTPMDEHIQKIYKSIK